VIKLPFPPSILSGHANGNGQWKKIAATKVHRALAVDATNKAKPVLAGEWDIPVHVRFVPPDRRSDRVNMPNRMKPYFDGIAEALGVNDVRFLPSYEFCEPEKPGRVEVFIPAKQPVDNSAFACCSCGNMPQIERPAMTLPTSRGPDQHNAIRSSADGS